MSERKYLNNDWKFAEDAESSAVVSIRIPHTCKEFPSQYFDEEECQMTCRYERALYIFEEWKSKALLLTFEGAAHEATVSINGKDVYTHRCGYTAFTIDISDYVIYGKPNTLSVLLDTHETLNIPPFGNHSSFLAYGGIYRDVYLDIKEKTYIRDVSIRTKIDGTKAQAISKVKIENVGPMIHIRQAIRRYDSDQEFTDVGFVPAAKGTMAFSLSHVHRWSPDDPALYEIRTELLAEGKIIDTVITRIGFREVEFRADGFYLNGKRTKIRGLSRYQSYPYVGYAMPDSMQKEDANILKHELCVNAVRCAQYTPSKAFLDRCDELGLLVLCEIPGSKFAGNIKWKNQQLGNVQEMIIQNRNHPSIISWGVTVNEDVRDEDFYSRINGLIHKLDPTRQTTAVCDSAQMKISADVYAYNDYTYDGTLRGNSGSNGKFGISGNAAGIQTTTTNPCRKKSDICPDNTQPYLISAFGGQTLPTRAADSEAHRTEQALLYSGFLAQAEQQDEICGSFGYAMTDYNAHKNYGSADRICYHGVIDMFRNPKLAAAAYTTYQDRKPVLEISSALSFGENPNQALGNVYIFTNADIVRMYRNNSLLKEYSIVRGLPALLDDFIGDAIQAETDFTADQQDEIRMQLNHRARFGRFQEAKKGLFGRKESVPSDVLQKMYEKYILGTEDTLPVYRFEAIQGGKIVSTLTRLPMKMHDLEIRVSSPELNEGKTYDVAAVRFRALDENGNLLACASNPLALKTDGNIDLIGPRFISLQGGMGGTYVRTNGKKGFGKLLISGIQNMYGDPRDHRGDGKPFVTMSGSRGYEIVFKVNA